MILGPGSAVQKIDDIQVLRAAAVIMVVIAHSYYGTFLPDIIRHGQAGVGLFFVVSGFVITRSSLARVGNGTPPWKFSLDFFLRRVFRILPAALIWLFIFAQFAQLTEFSLRKEVTGILTLRYNFMVKETVGALGHYWSLMVEEHFYLGFMILFPWAVRYRALYPLCAAGIAVVVFYLLPQAADAEHSTFARMDSFFAGILIATALSDRQIKPLAAWSRTALVFLASALLLIVATLFSFKSNAYTALMVTSAALVTVGALNQNVVLPIPYLRHALIWIGERSFSIYLSHPLVVYIDNWLRTHSSGYLAESDWQRILLNLFVMIMLGELSYRYIELTGERVGNQFRRWLLDFNGTPAKVHVGSDGPDCDLGLRRASRNRGAIYSARADVDSVYRQSN